MVYTDYKMDPYKTIMRMRTEHQIRTHMAMSRFGLRPDMVEALELIPRSQAFDAVRTRKPGTAFNYYIGPEDEKTRQFCLDVLRMDKLFSDEDIDHLSFLLGYSVFDYMGSYGCRHSWVRFRGREWSGPGTVPTDRQIRRLIQDQQNAGLAE